MKRVSVLASAFVVCLSFSARADMMYKGSLDLAGGGLTGAGFSVPPENATFAWEVSRDTSDPYNPWHYKYTLTFQPPVEKAISHFGIEVSDGFDSIFNVVVDPDTYPATWDIGLERGGSKDWVPGDIYGIKFDDAGDSEIKDTITFEFDSLRVPDWGDGNAKGGSVGSGGWWIYNSGFSDTEENDPIFDPTELDYLGEINGYYTWSGSVGDHLVVPDTNVVPVPTSILLGMLGLGAVGLKLRKFV